MITTNSKYFNELAAINVSDDKNWQQVNDNVNNYRHSFDEAMKCYQNFNLEKKRVELLRKMMLQNLEQLIVQFDTNFTTNGGKVLWANDVIDVKKLITKILQEEQITKVFGTKSSTIDEIELDSILEKLQIKYIETEFGRFVCRSVNQAPYQFQFSLLNRSSKDINLVLSETYNLKPNLNERQMSNFLARRTNEERLKSTSDACITGANFLVADTGSVVFTENEGNILKCMALSKLHIIIAGFDKVLPSIENLPSLLSMLSVCGLGQKITSFNTLINGDSTTEEGPKKNIVIILDNNRTEVLRRKLQRQALACIHCGACLNVCPVFQNLNSEMYDSAYAGPIGSVITPLIKGLDEYGHLASVCTLCAKCSEVCPVNIPIPNLILANRVEIVQKELNSSKERLIMGDLFKAFENRKKLDGMKSFMQQWKYKKYFAKLWGEQRELPQLAPKSFSEMWKEIEN